jgi:hypothetical protein
MRRVALVMGIALLSLGSASSSFAGAVNCKQVNKYLQTGRSPKDIAETMVIEESDVKKCQEEAGKEGGAAGGAAGTKEGDKGGSGKEMPK